MKYRTDGGIEYESHDPVENLMREASEPSLDGGAVARVIVRLEEMLEAAERDARFIRELRDYDREIIEAQERRVWAAEAKIDELAMFEEEVCAGCGHSRKFHQVDDGRLCECGCPEFQRATSPIPE